MTEAKKVIYYTNELTDEHSGHKIKIKKPIDKKYKYISKNPIHKFFTFVCYRLIATPIAFIYAKLVKKIKYENKQVLKQCKNRGYFIYANHTNQYSDVFSPHLITFPKKVYTIVNPENVNIPVIGGFTKMLGALPIPTMIDGTRNFMNAIEKRVLQGNPVLIYPEAHIWPYYTGIRPYLSTSFRYPVKFRDPSYCFTTTYQKGWSKKRPKIVIYVDGPFYPNRELSEKDQQEDLRNRIYETMKERSKNSNFEYYKYIKRGDTND